MLEITGVHPYADKFPMLPQSGARLVGVGSDALVEIVESIEHPGHFDLRIYNLASGLAFETKRPCRSRELIAHMVQKEAGRGEIRWSHESGAPRMPKTPVPRQGEPHVYFIADEDGFIKIGTARQVSARMASLQTASLIAKIDVSARIAGEDGAK